MEVKVKKLSRLKIGLVIFAAHTFFLIIKIIPTYLRDLQNPEANRSFSTVVLQLMLYYYLSALITPIILLAGVSFPFVGRHAKRNLVIHFLIACGLGVVQFYGYGLLLAATGFTTFENIRAGYFSLTALLNNGLTAIVFYVTIVAIQQAYLYFRESQERELRLRQAELNMLRAQLQPHFLFNALNAIGALIYKSPQDADIALTQLSDLLRISLKTGKVQEITLKEEMAFLQAYLQIHQTLMKQRLKVECNIHSETLDAMIPNMMLQPIVENSIKHGLAPLAEGGRIEIRAQRRNGKLNLLMVDNGRGITNGNSHTGIGLRNTRARLKSLYGSAHKLEMKAPPNGGFAVEIEIPFREQMSEAE